ncbi:MAG: hypothetical protein DLM63_12115 [Solirubrobacterales bacterium]|nr:MAG: hypothetical protein DLM63_12115 [Solirubrobacterales bacterium]
MVPPPFGDRVCEKRYARRVRLHNCGSTEIELRTSTEARYGDRELCVHPRSGALSDVAHDPLDMPTLASTLHRRLDKGDRLATF